MAQGKRISVDINEGALTAIRDLGVQAKSARVAAGDSQGTAATRLGVHVQTIGRIEAGEAGVAIGHVFGLLALYGVLPSASPMTGASATGTTALPVTGALPPASRVT
ncbi:helix-turn-helix domain-containing protein [Roseateles terrae]|uniref:DNA-binding XRE family transcriptional regulator n=1 Tax=Roseateles terrae TaxID=431060 RepID=A0ABR6GSN2_9BURK|nr:helix-turn-helix transcriptional regulator [Roseateles terrae]MBB3195120.1 DNA-binding XRE family transcriptional regulator [Roseateles terrae]OWQ87146.1 XRE family transcriptional regulator [Roseateles terrae]